MGISTVTFTPIESQRAHKNWETLGLKFQFHLAERYAWDGLCVVVVQQYHPTFSIIFPRFLTNLIFWSVHQPFADVETYTTESFLLISTLTTVPGLSFI